MFTNKSNDSVRPTIGIIGGSGPEATIYFQFELLKAMKENLKPLKDQDYYPVLVDNDPSIPDRSLAVLKQQDEIVNLYINRIRKLESLGASIIIIACNTAHAFIKKIQKAINSYLINIIEEVVINFVNTNKLIKKVGLLATMGTFSSKIYQHEFLKYGVVVEEISAESTLKVHQAIYGIKAGFVTDSDMKQDRERLYQVYKAFDEQQLDFFKIKSPTDLLTEILYEMHIKGINHVILGCTELPIALNNEIFQGQVLFNPATIIAKKTLYYCNLIENNNVPRKVI